jgi:hypothetical protein
MKLFHITKQGNLHFQLQDGRLAAVYPSTGYVRVSRNLKGFVREEYKRSLINRFNTTVENKNPGTVAMWPINKRVKFTKMHRVNMELFYKGSWNDQVYKYPQPVYYKYETSTCELYPNDIVKLMDLLTAFEAKNSAV